MKGIKLWHAIIWFTILVINLALMSRGQLIEAGLFELLCVILYASVFYINILYLFPEFYKESKGRYWLYGILLMSAGLVLTEALSEIFWGSHHHRREDWIEVVLTFRQALWVILVFMIGTLYSIQDLLKEQIIHKEKLMEEKLQTELQLLKAQINPHFLFNALNNVYSLTYMKSERAPESVLKLSDMLRYIMEDCSRDKVPLQSEINYIKNYIEFNKLKYPEKRNITFQYPEEYSDTLIAPMIFIPFIENCFKYSRIDEDKTGFISISISEDSAKVKMSAGNSIFTLRPLSTGSGKGIDNVRQRLEIIYPGKYSLKLNESDITYLAELEIDV